MAASETGVYGPILRRLGCSTMLILSVVATHAGCARWQTSATAPTPPLLGARWRNTGANDSGRITLAQRLRSRITRSPNGVADGAETLSRKQVTAAGSGGSVPDASNLADRQRTADDTTLKPPAITVEPPKLVEVPPIAAPKPVEVPTVSVPKLAEVPKVALPLAVPASSTSPTHEIQQLVDAARARLKDVKTYQVLLTRQERVGEALQPQEDVVLSIRREPRAVRLEWREGPHKGREVIYAAGQNGGLMHINMADSLVPVPRMSLAPDSPMVTRTSRHPITEAGLDSIVDRLQDSVKQSPADGAKLSFAGREAFEPGGPACDKIVRVTSQGETWHVYLDPVTHLPALVQEKAANGDLLERYRFGPVQTDLPELADAKAFDPDGRWGPARGLLQRLARSTSEPAANTQTR